MRSKREFTELSRSSSLHEMPKKKEAPSISIFGSAVEGRFSEKYLKKLGLLLAPHLAEVTGLVLNKRLWFMLGLFDEIAVTENNTFRASGDLIGPDSIGHLACITWQEVKGEPAEAYFYALDLKQILESYANITPQAIPISKPLFAVEWIPFWDSHLPDFFLQLEFDFVPAPTFAKNLHKQISSLSPSYHDVKKKGKRIMIHIDFGPSAPLQKNFKRIFDLLKKIPSPPKLTKVIVGVEGR